MNFLGLGVSFGAKDDGLITALGGIETRLAGIQESLVGMNTMQGASAAAQEVVASAGAMESSVASAADAFNSFGKDATDSFLGIGDTASDVETDVGSGLFKTRHRLKLTGFGFISLGAIVAGLTAPIRAVTKLMGGLAQSFSPAAFDDGLKKLQEGMNLMNSMESELFSTGVSARQMGAQFGYTGDALDKFESQAASMAYNLDVGIETAARAIRGFEEAGDEMRAVGFKNASEVAKFSEASGVNVDTLRNTFMAMTRVAGMTGDQIKQVASSMLHMGRKTGDVTGAMEQLPDTMEMIAQQVALLPPEYQLAGKEAADFAVQTAALTVGLFKYSQTSDKARSSSQTIAKAILEAQSGFQDMFTGVSDELPGFMTELAVIGVDTTKVFELMKQGPQGFVQGMTDLVAGMDRTDPKKFTAKMELVRTRLKQALGDEAATELTNFFLKADKATVKAMASVTTATDSLAQFGKEAHKASFNLSDRMDRALQRVNTSLRRMARPATRAFIKNLNKDVRGLSKRMRIAGKEGGVLGDALGIISRADQLGGLAFLPKQLRSTAVLAGEASGALMKTWEAFKAGGGAIGLVRNGIALFATDMVLTRKAGESWEKSFNRTANKFADIYAPMIEDAGDFVEKWIGKFADINWDNIFSGDADPKSAMGKIQKAFNTIDWAGIWGNLKKGLSKLWTAIEPSVTRFLDFVGAELGAFWENYGGPIRTAFWAGIIGLFSVSALMPILWGALTALGSAIASALLPYVMAAFASVGAAILGALTAPVWAIVGIVAAVVAAAAAIWYAFGDEIKVFANDLWNSVTYVFEKIGGFFSDLFGDDVTQIFNDLANSISYVFDKVAEYADNLLGGAFGKVWDFFTGGGEGTNKVAEGMKEAVDAAKGLEGFGKLSQHEMDRPRRSQFSYVAADPRMEAARKKQLAGMSEELQAIHDPLWWSGSGGYRDMFNQHMMKLTAAVREQSRDTAPSSPGGKRRMKGGKTPDNTTVAPASAGSR